MPWNVDLNKFPTFILYYDSHFFIIPITILLGLVIFFLSLRYKVLGSMTLLTKKKVNKNFHELNHNLRLIFHINKNILYTIEMLSTQALDFFQSSPNLAKENMIHIQSASAKGLNTLSQIMSMLDSIEVSHTSVDIKSCIQHALITANLPATISVDKCLSDNIKVNASDAHITELILNLLRNSAEAIMEKNETKGQIKIHLYSEDKLAVIEIRDNGIGIEKKNIHRIFDLLYSTKHNSKNWGIGLNFVKRVVDIYNGYMYVKSSPSDYTFFQILLPLRKECAKVEKED